MLSHLSATVLVRLRLHFWPCLPSPVSCISAAPLFSSSCVYVAVLIALSFVVPCTLPPSFVCLLRMDCLLTMRFSALHCFLWSAPHYFSHSPLWSSHYSILFSFVTSLLSLREFFALIRFAAFFLYLPSLCSAPTWLSPSTLSALICLLRLFSAQLGMLRSYYDLLAPICLDQLSQICSIFFLLTF